MKLTNGIDMSTGSLGQGFSAATGMAVAGKMDKQKLYIYTIIGDGESQEGQIWEAAMLAGSRKLDNLIAFTDYNKMQLDGYIEDVNGLYPLDKKWEAFGWHVQSVDGHDVEAISCAIDNAKKIKGKPSMIILNTIKGKGGYFCENLVESHNMSITEDMWKKAYNQVDKGEA
jgi:transketolase